MPRIKDLRLRLDWSQSRLAIYLGLSQDAVSLMERGQPESGPAGRLLDLLESAVADGRVIAGMDPAMAFAALGGGGGASVSPPCPTRCKSGVPDLHSLDAEAGENRLPTPSPLRGEGRKAEAAE